jgi:hypothetical protein
MRIWKIISLTVAFAMSAAFSAATSVSSLPLGPAAGGTELGSHLKTTSPLIEARSRRGRGIGAGVAAGLLLGGIVASQPSYYYRGYPPYPYYTPAYPVYGPYSPGDPAIAYCMRRFRSYDPFTMTYLGYDGYRYPCP